MDHPAAPAAPQALEPPAPAAEACVGIDERYNLRDNEGRARVIAGAVIELQATLKNST